MDRLSDVKAKKASTEPLSELLPQFVSWVPLLCRYIVKKALGEGPDRLDNLAHHLYAIVLCPSVEYPIHVKIGPTVTDRYIHRSDSFQSQTYAETARQPLRAACLA